MGSKARSFICSACGITFYVLVVLVFKIRWVKCLLFWGEREKIILGVLWIPSFGDSALDRRFSVNSGPHSCLGREGAGAGSLRAPTDPEFDSDEGKSNSKILSPHWIIFICWLWLRKTEKGTIRLRRLWGPAQGCRRKPELILPSSTPVCAPALWAGGGLAPGLPGQCLGMDAWSMKSPAWEGPFTLLSLACLSPEQQGIPKKRRVTPWGMG